MLLDTQCLTNVTGPQHFCRTMKYKSSDDHVLTHKVYGIMIRTTKGSSKMMNHILACKRSSMLLILNKVEIDARICIKQGGVEFFL